MIDKYTFLKIGFINYLHLGNIQTLFTFVQKIIFQKLPMTKTFEKTFENIIAKDFLKDF